MFLVYFMIYSLNHKAIENTKEKLRFLIILLLSVNCGNGRVTIIHNSLLTKELSLH